MAELTVTINSHHFAVSRLSPRGRASANAFASRFVQYGIAKGPNWQYVRTMLRVYAAATAERDEFRFHINTLEQFRQHLTHQLLVGELVEWVTVPIPEAMDVEYPIFPTWKAHDYQIPVIEYLGGPVPPRSKFVDMQTGKGKSFCALQAISNIGKRAMIIVKPMYLEKWIIDIRKTYDLAIEDLIVVRGSAQLMALFLLAEAGELDCKMILVSNKTIQNWLKIYEKLGQETLAIGYATTPDKMFEALKVGFRLIDEVHQDFHLNFKIDCYTNIDRAASLSATFKADDDFVNNMYAIAYPPSERYQSGAYDRYVAVRPVIFRFTDPNKIRWKDQKGNYSHHLVEQSILRSERTTANYLALIKRMIDCSYMVDYKKGERLIVFCASIELCTIVVKFLRQAYHDLDIRRYCEEDPFDNLMEADVSVTTLQSAGTAVDVPNLTTAILTVAISSTQSSLQSIGRLRKLKDITPEFLYFVCEDLAKHIEYHEKKKEMLKDKALTYKAIHIDQPV